MPVFRPSLAQAGMAVLLTTLALTGLAGLLHRDVFAGERMLQISAILFVVIPGLGALILLALLAHRPRNQNLALASLNTVVLQWRSGHP